MAFSTFATTDGAVFRKRGGPERFGFAASPLQIHFDQLDRISFHSGSRSGSESACSLSSFVFPNSKARLKNSSGSSPSATAEQAEIQKCCAYSRQAPSLGRMNLALCL